MFADLIEPDEIRSLIRDVPELNVILSYEEQFEDDEIYISADNAEDELFARLPVLKGKNIPKVVMNYLTLSFLLKSISAQELRNQMQINDNNVGAIDYSNKFGQYSQIAQQYKQEALEIAKGLAANNYFNGFWGGVESSSSELEGY